MRQYGENFHVDRQFEIVGNGEALCAGGNNEVVVVFEGEDHGELRGRLVREIEPDERLDSFRFSRGQEVQSKCQICVFIQSPGRAFGLEIGWSAWSPGEESA